MKDKTYYCSDCNKEIRNKSVSPELASLKLCPQCYTIRMGTHLKKDKSAKKRKIK